MTRRIVVAPATIWLCVAALAALLVASVVVSRAINALILLFAAIVVAEGIRPLVDWLASRRVPRALGVLLVYGCLIGALGGLGWFLIEPLTEQATTLVDNIPKYAAHVQTMLAQYRKLLVDNPQAGGLIAGLQGQASGIVRGFLGFFVSTPLKLAGVAADAVLLLLVALFWLLAADELRRFVLSLLPHASRPVASDALLEMGHKIGGYVRGVAINMLIIGALSGAGVALLRVPYPLLLAVIAGLTEAIPIIGPFLGGSVAVVVAIFAGGPLQALWVALLYVLIQQIEGNTLVPFVMNRVVALNPLTIIVALAIGTELLGIPGAILAVPAAAIVQVAVVRWLAPLVRRRAARSRDDDAAEPAAELRA